jgi:hypothetical protein
MSMSWAFMHFDARILSVHVCACVNMCVNSHVADDTALFNLIKKCKAYGWQTADGTYHCQDFPHPHQPLSACPDKQCKHTRVYHMVDVEVIEVPYLIGPVEHDRIAGNVTVTWSPPTLFNHDACCRYTQSLSSPPTLYTDAHLLPLYSHFFAFPACRPLYHPPTMPCRVCLPLFHTHSQSHIHNRVVASSSSSLLFLLCLPIMNISFSLCDTCHSHTQGHDHDDTQ